MDWIDKRKRLPLVVVFSIVLSAGLLPAASVFPPTLSLSGPETARELTPYFSYLADEGARLLEHTIEALGPSSGPLHAALVRCWRAHVALAAGDDGLLASARSAGAALSHGQPPESIGRGHALVFGDVRLALAALERLAESTGYSGRRPQIG